MHSFNYPAKFKRDKEECGFIIAFVDLPEAITQAETIEDSFIEAADCLEEAIAGRIDDGLTIPSPSKPRRTEHLISVPTHTAIKAALYLAMIEKKLIKANLLVV